jgi:hypothetical protein
MGWGARLLGIGQIVGGAVLTGVSGGSMAGVGIPMMTSGVGNLVADQARNEGNEALDTAASQLTQSNDRAIAHQGQIFQGQQSALAPYAQRGSQAMDALGSMMGYAPMPASQLPGLATGPTTGAAQAANNFAVPRDEGSRPGAVRSPQMLDPQTQATMQTQSAYQGASGLGDLGPRVTLKAPTGETIMLPVGDPNIQKALARGAVQV